MRNIVYDLLSDIYYRFTISFGYFQYATLDMDREDRKHANHSDDWRKIEDIMRDHKNSMIFLWELVVIHGRMTVATRPFPKWYDDFGVTDYTTGPL